MDHHYSTVFSNQQGITARICPRGVIALSIGHTTVTLQQADFLRLAQAIRGAESYVFERRATAEEERQYSH
jgi:hypothetical protein